MSVQRNLRNFMTKRLNTFKNIKIKLSSPEGQIYFKYGAWWDGKPVVYQDNSDDSDFQGKEGEFSL